MRSGAAGDTVIAVLVGGHSRRMGGRAKATLPLAGHTVLEHLLESVTPLGRPVLLVGPHPDAGPADPARAALLARLGLPVTHDRHPDLGPLGGLDAAFAASGADRVLLLACDLPFVTTDFLAWLLERAAGPDAAAVPAAADGRLHPLCAVYGNACRPALATALDRRRLRMHDFVRDVEALVLAAAAWRHLDRSGCLLANLNTPDDYESAVAWLAEDGRQGPA